MKTTVEISDSLMASAKKLAKSERIPLRRLIEEGLRRVISEHDKTRHPFRLQDASFTGEGLTEEAAGLSWAQIRDDLYKGRGA